MECIYYKDKEGLEWKGQEHIFPASLGGIKKLPAAVRILEGDRDLIKILFICHGTLVLL